MRPKGSGESTESGFPGAFSCQLIMHRVAAVFLQKAFCPPAPKAFQNRGSKMIRFPAPAHLALAFSALCMLAVGCTVSPYSPLPKIEDTVYQRSLPENQQNGTELAWQGSRRNLSTFWGRQDVRARVRAFLPDSWNKAGDGIWRAQVRNREAKPLPFLGILRTSGKESRIVPSVDPGNLPDGLYSLIIPGIETRKKEIVAVAPRLLICEIRDGRFQPFRVAVPLHPLNESPLTGSPPSREEAQSRPEGTPYPFTLPPAENK
jgi:hypothetical protein